MVTCKLCGNKYNNLSICPSCNQFNVQTMQLNGYINMHFNEQNYIDFNFDKWVQLAIKFGFSTPEDNRQFVYDENTMTLIKEDGQVEILEFSKVKDSINQLNLSLDEALK